MLIRSIGRSHLSPELRAAEAASTPRPSGALYAW